MTRDVLTELNWPVEGLCERARIWGKKLLWCMENILGKR